MKKLIAAFLSIFVVAVAAGQTYPVTQNLGNTPTTLVTTNSIKANQGIILGSFADTTAANVLPYLKNYTGAAIWSTSDSSIYVRLKTATSAFWFKIGGAGGGATGSYWSFTGNVFPVIQAGFGLGTNDETNLPIKTNNITRLTIPYTGLAYMSASTDSIIVRDASGNVGLIPKSGGGVVSAWELSGNSTTDPSTNWVGTNDSISWRIKVNGRNAGWIHRSGVHSNGYSVNYTNSFTAFGTLAGNTLIDRIIAGTETGGQLNTLYGAGAGMYIGAQNDTVRAASNQNVMVGLGAGQWTQGNSFVTGTGRNVLMGESACYWCLTPGENTGIGSFALENGFRPTYNTAVGSNALRTANSVTANTSIGAYAGHYNGCVVSAVNVTSGGSGYTTATVSISAPFATGSPGACIVTATATATISGGQIIAITITNPGCGYTNITGTYNSILGSNYKPVVTITGDGVGATADLVITCADYTTNLGHTAAWLTRAPQYGIYIGKDAEPSTRYYDEFCTAFGRYAGIDASVSNLQKMTNAWAFGTRAKVSTNRTMVFGAPVGDTTMKLVVNAITGDSTFNVYGDNGGSIYATGGANVLKDSYFNTVRIGRGNSSISTNTAVGDSALSSITSSSFNTAIGQGALKSATSGVGYNTVLGYGAGRSITTQTHNTAIGALALSSINTGPGNVNTAVGYGAMQNATTSFWNTAIGAGAMNSYTSGSRFGQGVNTVVGANAGYNLTSGEANNFLGERAGGNISAGIYNVAIGNQALGSTATGSAGATLDSNIAIGVLSLGSNTGGDGNTAIGNSAGRFNTTGSYNVYVGGFNGTGVGTVSRHAFFSDGLGTVRMMWDSTGAVGIGTSTTAPATSSILDLTSTTKGFLAPRMTAAQRGAIGSPATGLFVWDSDSARYMAYNGSTWKGLKYTDEGGGGGSTSPAGNFGNLQINRNGAFATPGSDSLDFESATGLTVKGNVTSTGNFYSGSGIWFASSTSGVSQGTLFGSPGLLNQIIAGQRWMVIDNGPSGAILDLQTGSYPSYDNATFYINARTNQKQGADVASAAGAITLGRDGNVFEITGTSAITAINNTNWQNGATVTLLFTSTASLTHGTANSGTSIGFELAGAANFNGTAGDVVVLVLSEIGGTQRWRMVSASVN